MLGCYPEGGPKPLASAILSTSLPLLLFSLVFSLWHLLSCNFVPSGLCDVITGARAEPLNLISLSSPHTVRQRFAPLAPRPPLV